MFVTMCLVNLMIKPVVKQLVTIGILVVVLMLTVVILFQNVQDKAVGNLILVVFVEECAN